MHKKKNFLLSTIVGTVSLFLFAFPVSAHVIVSPHQAGIAATQDFTVSVPNERDKPVVSLKLLLPKGLQDVTPNATPDWKITVKSKGSGNDAVVSEIDWENGSIPVGQRTEFIFQAQVPPTPTTLDWKAYQTYADGTVVSWDVDPAKMADLSDAQQDQLADKENRGEYSTTQVINDLAPSNPPTDSSSSAVQVADVLSGFAIIIAIAALALVIKKNNS